MRKSFLLFIVAGLAASCSDPDVTENPVEDAVDTHPDPDVTENPVEDAVDTQVSDLPGESDSDEVTQQDSELPNGGVGYAFMAVHLDPGSIPDDSGNPNTARPVQCWPTLIELVEAADAHDSKLTLMFTGQWGYYLREGGDCVLPGGGPYTYQSTDYATCSELVSGFEANGHAIAFHHHPHGNPRVNWDGFSNDPIASNQPQYLGTVAEAKAFVDALSSEGAAGVVSGTTEEFPLGGGNIAYTSARGPTAYVDAENRGDLASRPCAWAEDNHNVWRMRMRSYTGPSVYELVRETELPAAINDLEGTDGQPWTVGFVTHAVNVQDYSMVPYEALFDALHDAGLTLQTLETVEEQYAWTTGDPASSSSEYLCPPNEGEVGE